MTNEEATIDIEATAGRLQAILHPETGKGITVAPQTQPTQPPAPNRKPRSDKGIPKKPPADPDEITLRMTISEARDLALEIGVAFPNTAARIQDQIITQLQKRLDSLSKQK